MKNLKTFIGLLNTTLKGIRLVSGNPTTDTSAKFIMLGILNSIESEQIAYEFISYCKETYSIDLN